MKKSSFIYISIFLFTTNTHLSIFDELSEIFISLPIHNGVERFIDESNLEYEYWKTVIPLTNGNVTESWKSKVYPYDYISNFIDTPILEINKEVLSSVTHYDISLRFKYQDSNILEREYNLIRHRLSKFSEIIEESDLTRDSSQFKVSRIDLSHHIKESQFIFSMLDSYNKVELLLKFEIIY